MEDLVKKVQELEKAVNEIVKKVNGDNNTRDIEIQGLIQRYKELQSKMDELKQYQMEMELIKNRFKELFPEGGVYRNGKDILVVKTQEFTKYNIPDEIKQQFAEKGKKYIISIEEVKENGKEVS
jgi:predicted nuclease with TOPRIM domain